MRKHLFIFAALPLLTMSFVTAEPNNTNVQSADTLLKSQPALTDTDLSYADFDSIASHASILYASKVLNENGFKLAFGNEVKQRRRYFSDITFAKGAEFDVITHSWLTTESVPYTYVSLIYSDEFQQLCHYHIKFRNWVGYALFFGEALKAGYLIDEPYTESESKKRKKSVYFRYSDQSFLMFTEYDHKDYYVDYWKVWSNYKNKKRSYEK